MSKSAPQREKIGIHYRSFEVDRASIAKDTRSVDLSFSSEAPVQSWYPSVGSCMEVLDHEPSSVDLTRLNNGAPLLMEHDRCDQVGIVEKAWIDNKRGMARVRFGSSTRAQEIFQDVNDGIRRLVSVGYRVYKAVTDQIEAEVETLRAVGWEPMEISIVSVPADITVGIGRTAGPDANEITLQRKKRKMSDENNTPPAPSSPAPATVHIPRGSNVDPKEMLIVCKRANRMDVYERAIENGWEMDKFREELLKEITSKPVPMPGVDANPDPSRTRDGQTIKTPGEMLIANEQFRAMAKSGGRKQFSMETPHMGLRATLLTTGLTGYERPPGIVNVEQQPITIAQLMSQGETTSPTIRIFKESSYTQAATAVAEEGQKPEATFALAEADFPVKKIAVVGRLTDEMLHDFPAVRDYINQRLAFMVQALEDNHLLNGTGSSNQITGILQTSGIQTEVSANSGTISDAIHKAITKVRSVGFFEPDAIIMHPTDWQNLRLSKDANGQYYAGGPFTGTYGVGNYTFAGVLWGKNVVVTTAISQGTALVGAFKIGAQIFRRMGLTVETTNSDASDFQYNRIAIRVEERLALVVYRALAFCTVTGIPSV